ncbi:SRPBCC family protein [Longispora albida]|uniref:SRPBCC family protein n=1 Tax=Longispora albida TaxID=203523 RepID=UPI00058F6065|nr:SRPBCC family protein [Longispora albida]
MRVEVSTRLEVDAPPERVYGALVDWERQGEWVPLTTVRVLEGDGTVGSLVEAVTALGPFRLVDLMRVGQLEAPYRIKVLHCGKQLKGPGLLECTRLPADRTRLTWAESLDVPAVVGFCWPVLRPFGALLLRAGLKRLARNLARPVAA